MKKFLSLVIFVLLGSLSGFAQKTIKIACVGASITEGYGTSDWKTKSYPGQLEAMLGEGYKVDNFGRGGCTMLRKGDCPYWNMEKFQPSLKSNPDIVFIDLGGNDAKARNRVHMADFVKDACDLVATYQQLPTHPRVILMTAILGFTCDTTEIWDPAIVRDINPLILEAARKGKVEVLDMHPVMAPHVGMMPDGVHPNDVGAGLMAKKMADYLKQFPVKPSEEMTIDGMADNPFITHLYTADPSAHVWKDGRLYVYASHDIDPPRGCDLMDAYHVFSTDDMIHWKDHGEILNSSQVKWGRKEGGFMWAPDCAYANGKYYFYFPHPSETITDHSWKIGVAVSKKPASDFKVVGYIKGAPSFIDPCVFIDDDGTAYVYNGGGGTCMGGKLKKNMVELDGEMKPMEGLVDFHEATWVHKYNGKYYLSYGDNHMENGKQYNRLCYAMSDSPLGPWEYKGVYLQPTDCDTSHGSIVEYKGQWYAFYHGCALSRRGNLRSICVDKLYYNPDGTIQTVNQRAHRFHNRK